MLDKTKFLSAVTDIEHKKILTRLFDKAEQTEKYGETRFCEFCAPEIIDEVEKKALFLGGVSVSFYGGYGDAERRMAAFSMGEIPVSSFPVSAVRVNAKGGGLSHRDYLGSIIGAGLGRERIGDILVDDDGAVVICDNEMAKYLAVSLRRVGNTNVNTAVFNLDELEFTSRGFRDITSTVASLRLDAVLSLMLKTSRTKAADFIKAQKVFVNGALCVKGDQQLKQGDVLTVRGRGKAILDTVGNQSKKGRTFITVKKYV